MSSHHTEDIHASLLKEILSDLNCVRSRSITPLTPISSPAEKSVEEEGRAEEEGEPESPPEEEHEETEWSEAEDEQILLFPTPSLRKLLPQKTRKTEAHNRIHVLPEEFKTNIDPQAIPNIKHTAQKNYIDILAEIVGFEYYRNSLAEFWFLDTLANLLRRAQEDKLPRSTQAVLILWWCEWMKEIQEFDNADRPRMMRRFKDNMLSAARYIEVSSRLPTPDQAGVDYKARAATEFETETFTFDGLSYECSLRDLTMILHYIYDVFSTDFQFNLVRSVFTFPPGYNLIDAPYQMKQPKSMYTTVKYKPKKTDVAKPEGKDGGKKGKKEEKKDNEEYLYLMSVKARQQLELEEQAEIEFEQWQRVSHILPLQFAIAEDFLDKYWPPPPPPPEPEPEPEPEPVLKKKGKK